MGPTERCGSSRRMHVLVPPTGTFVDSGVRLGGPWPVQQTSSVVSTAGIVFWGWL